jgi:hypothetical protein
VLSLHQGQAYSQVQGARKHASPAARWWSLANNPRANPEFPSASLTRMLIRVPIRCLGLTSSSYQMGARFERPGYTLRKVEAVLIAIAACAGGIRPCVYESWCCWP